MKKKFIFIIGIGLLSSYSCQKALLNPVSQTSISTTLDPAAPFNTPARILSQVLGLYTNFKSGQMYGGRYQVYNDVKAENWINITANSVTAYQTYTETVSSTSSEVLNLWNQAYFTINNCNLFIDGMALYNTGVVTTTVAANYVAEAKVLRAMSYYALLQFYCQPFAVGNGASPGVPLRLTGNALYGNYDMAPATVAQVYAQIIADLDAAETALPLTYADALTNTTRVHRNTAIALKTRVYLSMQNYAKVVTEAAKIVPQAVAPFSATSGVANALQTDITKVFTTPYTTTESMFSAPFTATETPGTQNQLGFYFNANGTKAGNAEFYLNPAGVIADPNWKAADKRRTFIYTSTVSGHTTQQFLSKFATLSPYNDYAPIMRYAEVLLNYAEAKVRSTGIIDNQSLALLNAVRGRSDASTVYTLLSFPGGVSDFYTVILQERNIEFLGEGLRWADLARLTLPIPAKSNVAIIVPTNSNYIWPMSGNEQIYNKLIGR